MDGTCPATTTPPEEEQVQELCPEVQASWISKVTSSWLDSILSLGYKRPLNPSDLYTLDPKFRTAQLGDELEKKWLERKNIQPVGKWPLFWALSDAFGTKLYMSGILKFVGDAATMASPYILRMIIKNMEGSTKLAQLLRTSEQNEKHRLYGYGLCVLLLMLQLLSNVVVNFYFTTNFRVGLRARTALNAAVYKKSQKLSGSARQEFSTGQMVNLISTDSSRIENSALFFHYIWSGPFQIIVILGLLYILIGPSVFVGLLTFAVFIPVQSKITTWLSKYRKETTQISDKRVRLMQEIIQGIRVIKFYAWEDSFLSSLFGLRNEELARVKKSQYMRSITSGITVIVPIFSSIGTFLAYHWMGHKLTPDVVFPVLTYFNQLRLPLVLLPMVISMIVDAKVSLVRLQKFLLAEELHFEPEISPNLDAGMVIENAEFEWPGASSGNSTVQAKDLTSKAGLLENESIADVRFKGLLGPINLSVPKGSLVAVIGPVGSGKSSLLNSLVGEMNYLRGRVIFGGNVGYAPQQAWIQNKNVKDNILFGRPFDPSRYEMIIDACALQKDFEMLPDGDLTEIGEKGVNLSGGQKQRISLARIMYSNPDIVLLDDPLSAVDAHVGKHIFDRCLKGLLKDKTRILVTHQLHLLPKVDLIVVMNEMQIVEQGTFQKLMDANGPFSDLMRKHGGIEDDSSFAEPEEPIIPAVKIAKPKFIPEALLTVDAAGVNASTSDVTSSTARGNGKLTTTEERMTGAVAWKVYSDYINWAGGSKFIISAVVLLLLYNGSKVGNDLWLSFWTETPPRFNLSTSVYVGVYVVWGIAQALFGYLVGILFALSGIRASSTLHYLASRRVLGSPVSFFDQNPLGRIINRFSKDMDTIDNQLPESLRSFVSMLGMGVSSLVLICLVSWAFIPIMLVLGIVYYWVQLYYRCSSRELKRLDSLARSPFYAQFSETLTGLATIRAFREQERFIETNAELADKQNQPFFLQQSMQRWLGLRLEGISNLLVFSAAISCYYLRVTPSSAGLAIGYSLSIAGVLNWLVRQISETESNIIASERLGHYVDLPIEESSDALTGPDENWPKQGSIQFKNVSMRYRPELPPVLDGIHISVKSGERVGIVGRTGAGKSSIMVTLFRLTPLSEGSIFIDGQDISSIPLKQLRQKISIIPQDPVVFAGSIRSNLDPFGQYSDAELWMSLKRAHLGDFVSGSENGLDSVVQEAGENLSVGQRQLLCLARAILRNNRILVLDEATANIDLATDALIQESIRRDFDGCTILTIAHRLNTVIDYDKILVLDHGRVAEFDAPSKLLADPDSLLSGLVRETGSNNEALLKSLAKA